METNNINNNAAAYTTAGTVTGAGIGIATGYLTRPYLKNGTMTDEFAKKVNSKLAEELELSSELKEATNVVKDKLSSLKNAQNFDELKQVLMGTCFAEDLDEKFKGKTLEEAKSAIMDDIKAYEKQVRDLLFKPHWDSAKKKFINCEDMVGKALKKTASSIQGKYAAIYGAVGAAVLGGITYLCTRKGNSEQ